MKGKMKGFGLYLIILVCLLAGVSYVVSQTQQTETLSYNQIYNYFMDGDVDQYDVDDTTLTMHLKKENQTYTYDLGDYRSVFYNDLGETIQQQMRDGTLTKVDYRTATIPWWAQFLPYVILIVLLIAFWCFMMNKQSGGGAGPMQFGKAVQSWRRTISARSPSMMWQARMRKRPSCRKLSSSSRIRRSSCRSARVFRRACCWSALRAPVRP